MLFDAVVPGEGLGRGGAAAGGGGVGGRAEAWAGGGGVGVRAAMGGELRGGRSGCGGGRGKGGPFSSDAEGHWLSDQHRLVTHRLAAILSTRPETLASRPAAANIRQHQAGCQWFAPEMLRKRNGVLFTRTRTP